MVIIETIEDFLKALRENEDFLAAARREIYTQDLLSLPSEFREYSEKTDARLETIEGGVDNLKEDMFDVRGFELERRIASRLRQQIGSALDLTTVRAIWVTRNAAQATGRARNFERDTEDASESGTISHAEADRLIDTDTILSGLKATVEETVYVSVEASGVIKSRDIGRARESADILRRLYETEATPAVYGYRIEQPQVAEAQADSVAGLSKVRIFLEAE